MNAPAVGGPLRAVFFGSPSFAAPILVALADDPAFVVTLVVTQGDKGASPVETVARELGLPVYKPESLRDADSRQPLAEAGADLFVTAAFGLIFRKKTLSIPRLGAVNIHPSVLPRYRGASPIAAVIAQGDVDTGVSLMVMDEGIDTGAVVSLEPAIIAPEDTTESLGARLAAIGARQAVRDIPRWARGELESRPQPLAGASVTRMLTKADGWLDWSLPAIELERQVRAMWPWPRAWTTTDDAAPLQVHAARVLAETGTTAPPGTVIPRRGRLIVAAGHGALELLEVEPAGRRAMDARAYLNGRRVPLVRLGQQSDPGPRPPLVVPICGDLVG